MAVQDYKINYKSDFVLNINGDAGWAVPFCIKFWTGMPSQAYFVGFDGVKYVNCRVGDTPTQLLVMFDDHHLPIGPLKMQIAYHTTIEEFPDRKFDEVTNPTNVTVDIDGTEYQVMLDFTGETGAEIDFSMPSSGVMSVNGKIGYVTLTAEDVGAQPTIEDLATIRSGAAEGATAVQPAEMTAALATKQDAIPDLANIRSGAAAGATAVQPAAMNTALAAKQDTLTFDNTPTANSNNPVKSSGIKTALDAKQSTISTVNVTVDNNTGTPSGSASVSGSTLSLSFQNLKGATGATGATGPQGPQGERGLPGESGVTGDVSGFTVIQTIDPSATYGATDIAGAATVQATNAELTELEGELTDVEDYVMPSEGVDETYDQTALVNSGQILQTSGATRSFSGFKTSNFIEIPQGTKYLYTSNLYKNDNNSFIGLKFYTSNSVSGVISANVAASGQAIPTTIDMEEWPTAKYLRFCSNKSTASVRFYAEAGQSQLINELISQETGQSTVVTMSQKAITDELDNMSNDIAEITADGVDFTFDSSNSSMASSTLLNINGTTRSMAGYSTSVLLDIPARTKYLDTYGLLKNDANQFIGLVLYNASGTKLANVCASGEAIPSTIDLATNYPTAAKLRWCTKGNANAYVRCYSVSAIKTAVLCMVDDQVGQDDEALMSQKGITDAIANMAEELKTSEYIELQNDSLVEDSGNWTFGTAWSYSANGATPPDVGAANYMRNTSIYYSDRRFMRISALMGADTKLIITCSYGSSLNAGEGASAFGVDFANKNLIIYGNTGYGSNTGDTQATSEGYDLTKTVESVDIPDAMIGARKYVIELRKYGTISQLTLMDTKTGASVSVFHDGWACGRQNQLYGFYCESGTLPTLSNFGVYSAKNPDIVFAGDSITEGVYVSDRQYTYANRFRSDMPSKSVVVSARGGQTISGLMSLFTTEWNIVRPKAISLLIGANGGNSASNFTAFKNACDAIGAKLYVHYCSCRTGRDLSETNNTLVPNLHLESAHFDWATATDNTPNSSYSNINSSLFADSTHPNITGQAEMYKRLKIDCPSMYM